MKLTLLVHLNIVDVTTIADESAAVEDALTKAGFDVDSVVPWARPTLNNQSVAPLIQGLTPPPTEPPLV